MSADWLDDASDREQEIRDDSIAAIRRQVEADNAWHENCAFCGDPSHGAKYCSQDCALEAQYIDGIRKKQGLCLAGHP